MSDFTVLRSLDGYCLVLDNKRIAGGKPDYRGENVLVDWTTEVAYGPVDDLAAENAKLRELCHDMLAVIIGWSWKFNELAGYQLDDEDTYPSRVMHGFIDRARELEVPL